MKKKRLLKLALVAILLLNALMIAYFVSRFMGSQKYNDSTASKILRKTSVARVGAETGKLLVKSREQLNYRLVVAGEELFGGDIVQTTENSSATLLFNRGAKFKMGANSLLVIGLREEDSSRIGSVMTLKLEKGVVSIEGKKIGSEISALQTPQSTIRLDMRDSELYSPEDAEKSVGPGHIAVLKRLKKYPELRHSYLYLAYLQEKYAPLYGASRTDPAYARLIKLVDDAANNCGGENKGVCEDKLDAAWKEVSRVKEIDKKEENVVVAVTVAESGDENIDVQKGSVTVQTETRTLAVAEGEKLTVEPGKVNTQAPLTEETRKDIIAEEPIFYLEVEELSWQ